MLVGTFFSHTYVYTVGEIYIFRLFLIFCGSYVIYVPKYENSFIPLNTEFSMKNFHIISNLYEYCNRHNVSLFMKYHKLNCLDFTDSTYILYRIRFLSHSFADIVISLTRNVIIPYICRHTYQIAHQVGETINV